VLESIVQKVEEKWRMEAGKVLSTTLILSLVTNASELVESGT
jgi:hypothetical protein